MRGGLAVVIISISVLIIVTIVSIIIFGWEDQPKEELTTIRIEEHEIDEWKLTTLQQSQIIALNLENTEHQIKLNSAQKSTVELTYGEGITIFLDSEGKEVDLNSDGKKDIKIQLIGRTGDKVQLAIKKIEAETGPKDTPPENNQTTNETETADETPDIGNEYLIQEDLGNYKYLGSDTSSPDDEIDFSGDFVEGYKATYEENRFIHETVDVNVWVFEDSNNLDEDIEGYIFEYLRPNQPHYSVSLFENNKVIAFGNTLNSDNTMTIIWPSGNKIIKIKDTKSFAVEMEYFDKYPSTFEVKKTCDDDDNGKDYLTGGSVKFLPEGPNAQYGTFKDACVTGEFSILREGYCENGRLAYEEYDCPSQCVHNPNDPWTDACGDVTVVPFYTFILREYPSEAIYAEFGVNEDLESTCEVKITQSENSTTVLDWETVTDISGTRHQIRVDEYFQDGLNYLIEGRCHNVAGYGEIASQTHP